ncbi:GAD-like domain protein [compost metagenome]
MLQIWQEEGWASYGNGRIWTVNPEDYEHIKDAWLSDTPLASIDNFHVVARSAFGDLYLSGEKRGEVSRWFAFSMKYWHLRTD